MKHLKTNIIVVACYILCHGLVQVVTMPIQLKVLPDVTPFASLIYLPHGVRVLTSWLLGWRAVLPLFLGSFGAHAIFHPDSMISHLWFFDPIFLLSLTIGATAAVGSFELLKIIGLNLYAGPYRRVKWTGVLLVGIVASVLNALGQSFAFSGIVVTDVVSLVFWTYVFGDAIGLLATMIVLALVFRFMRHLHNKSRN
ncbi:hypothetical protein KUV57_13670 [Epibacterium sp. DP7N7-1]|nr:hypothetical protein [Epibacterium sp. DP7N7-1]